MHITNDVANSGTLNLSAGALASNIAGVGTTNIKGNVSSDKTITQNNFGVDSTAKFTNNSAVTVNKVLANSGEIENIKKANKVIEEKIEDERKDIIQILAEVRASNEILKNSIEAADVNEAYIYDILDKWAELRHVKIKK